MSQTPPLPASREPRPPATAPQRPDEPVVRTEALAKRYHAGDHSVLALARIDLTIRRGEFLAVMGASGSGKSTLLHILGGLDTPTAGRVIIEGRDLAAMSDAQRTVFRRRRLGVVFQTFNLLPNLTARENIALPMVIDNLPPDRIRRRTDELLALVDLTPRADHRPAALSGGEQQRVAIARALLNDPALILADEPTGNLDSRHAEDIWRLLRRLASELHRTVVMVTHEAAGAAWADRVVVLKDGRLVGQFFPHGDRDATLVAARYQELAG